MVVAGPAEPPLPPVTAVMPGDADSNYTFDQLDLVQVQIAAKYLTGKTATWAEGDWTGDGVFSQLDVVAALQTGNYLRGPYGRPPTDHPPAVHVNV